MADLPTSCASSSTDDARLAKIELLLETMAVRLTNVEKHLVEMNSIQTALFDMAIRAQFQDAQVYDIVTRREPRTKWYNNCRFICIPEDSARGYAVAKRTF